MATAWITIPALLTNARSVKAIDQTDNMNRKANRDRRSEKLGECGSGVEAYALKGIDAMFPHRDRQSGLITGIEWQCVEYARRWLIHNLGLTFADVPCACDIWRHIQAYHRIDSEQPVRVESNLNGEALPPGIGSLLIYGREYKGTGHVAVVTGVDFESSEIRVCEANYLNRYWPGDYARRLPLVARNGGFWVLDAHLIGWKTIA